MSTKTEDAFKTISEASASLDVPPHVLRFWESKFRSLRPLKRSGGRRYYRPADLATLRRIRQLLYVDGFTIKGAQKLISGKTPDGKSSIILDSSVSNAETIASAMAMLQEVKLRLAALKKQLGS
jgi:DNA-binding transcriptional MerR regulator